MEVRMRLAKLVSDNLLGMALTLGNDLKLFDAIASVSSPDHPATAKEIADKVGLKERYVKEWLCSVACGGFVEIDEQGERFWLTKENEAVLSGPNPEGMLGMLKMVLQFSDVLKDVEEVFQKDGPPGLPYERYKGIHYFIDLCSESKFKEHTIPSLLPLLGVSDKFEKGNLNALDVGCGTGFQSNLFAQHFPKSFFTGIDSNADAINRANKRKEEKSVQNVNFIQMDASKLPDEWTNRFDWVMIFDACHDQVRPDLSLREIHRVLTDDGVLSVIEVNGSSNAFIDKTTDPGNATFLYAISTFHCLPVGSNSKDALCLGSMWGKQRAVKLFRECGFTNVQVVPTPFFQTNILYLCKK